MEKRMDTRVVLQSTCKARFQLDGQSFINVPVVNLGSHGCCFIIPEPAVNRFKAGPVLEGWKLVHPKLPKGSIKAKVVWCRAQGKARPGMLEAGVQFMEVPETYSKELDRFLTAKPRTGKSGKES
jgi:hypothetical protein